MQIPPLAATPARRVTAKDMLKVTAAEPEKASAAQAALNVAGIISTPVELYAVGKAALGDGAAGAPVRILAGVGASIGLYRGIRGLATHRSAEQINNALKDANGGRDLQAADAEFLAQQINHRSHLNAMVGIANSVATGAAIVSGNLFAGLAALALKGADVGYGVYSANQTMKDFTDVLMKQPAPAPTPQPPAASPAPASVP